MGPVQLFAYVALAAFVLGCLGKALRYARMPMHLRWELYPIAHEKGRAAWGGGYFEEVDWWTKPRETSALGEVRTIAAEVLTLAQVRERNRPLWLPSLLFHWGLYLLFGLGAALLLGALPGVRELPQLGRLGGGRALALWAGTGLTLGTLGAAGLLARRVSSGALRRASTPADFSHLALLLAVFVASWGSLLSVDGRLAVAARFARGLVLFRWAGPLPPWFSAQVLLLGLFLLTLPFSHMTHFFGKYFTWHSVRWDDVPNLRGRFDAKAEKLLVLPISWSAPHIRGGGGKRWVDAATEKAEG